MLTQLFVKLGLLDTYNDLSLTNVVVYALLIKALCTPQLGIGDAIVFGFAVANYCHKRFEISRSEERIDIEVTTNIAAVKSDLESKIAAVKDEIGRVSVASGFFKR